jgi:hypothetical protein
VGGDGSVGSGGSAGNGDASTGSGGSTSVDGGVGSGGTGGISSTPGTGGVLQRWHSRYGRRNQPRSRCGSSRHRSLDRHDSAR